MADPTPSQRDRADALPVPLIPLRDRDLPIAPLPSPLTSFVGREREVAAVAALLRQDGARLVTLTGPGGVGKTRLALKVAAELAPVFADGVAFVPLAPVADPDLVAATVARALGVREVPGWSPDDLLANALGVRRLLLVLDNFEHVVEAAPQVAGLLAACPNLAVLATSRALLRVSGEHGFPVPPLSLPGSATATTAAVVGSAEAVRLFIKRAQAVNPAFALTDANAAVVADVCRRLDGLPLAVELAAARADLLTPSALLSRLDRRLPLLTTGPRDAPARLRTLRDAIAWSHALLSPAEQRLFRRLAVFADGFSVEAAEAVCEGMRDEDGGMRTDETIPPPLASTLIPHPSVFDGIASLAANSLLRQEPGSDEEPRFGMLETVREYGLERLAASGEAEEIRRRHAAWCLALAEQAEIVAAWGGPEHKRWLDRLEAELPNLRAALAWLAETGDAEASLVLAGALVGVWHFRGHRAEGRAWLEPALARGGGAPTAARAKALRALGTVERFLGGGRAVAFAAESLAIWRELGEPRRIADALLMLGIELEYRAEHARAAAVLEEAAELLDGLGEPARAAVARLQLGVGALESGDGARGEALLGEALSVFRREGTEWAVGGTLQALGQAAEDRGDPAAAAARYAESLSIWAEIGHRDGLPDTLNGAARLAAAGGRPVAAARLLGAAAALGETLENLPRPAERARTERATAAACAALGDPGFAAAWAAGRALPPEQAAAEAADVLDAVGAAIAPSSAANDAFGLTPRECEVLRLLAAGRSNREIGEALFISPRTAQTHVTHLLAKLGLPSRTAAAAFAHAHGLA